MNITIPEDKLQAAVEEAMFGRREGWHGTGNPSAFHEAITRATPEMSKLLVGDVVAAFAELRNDPAWRESLRAMARACMEEAIREKCKSLVGSMKRADLVEWMERP
jgi:hypothetical protein